MTRTYFIIKWYDNKRDPYWVATRKNIWNMIFGFYDDFYVSGTYSCRGPDDCEERLRNVLNPKKCEVIRVLTI